MKNTMLTSESGTPAIRWILTSPPRLAGSPGGVHSFTLGTVNIIATLVGMAVIDSLWSGSGSRKPSKSRWKTWSAR